jgi:hypothetical protein
VSVDRDAYDAGHTAGGIDARLAQHDVHFAQINGSIARVGNELAEVKLLLQRLADSADSDRRTVVTTASALKDAEDARRSSDTDHWSPWQKLFATVGALAALGGLIALVVTLGTK